MQSATRFQGTHFSKLAASNCFCICLLMIYIFGLPLWSYLANQKMGYFEELCTTPAQFVQCGDGQNYTEIAESLGRKRPDIGLVGCTCGEGVFGDYACPVVQDGKIASFSSSQFSISYYIATSSGTGAMAALSFFPLLFVWGYGLGFNAEVESHVMKKISPSKDLLGTSTRLSFVFWTQVMFQVLYGAFLFCTVCIAPTTHTIAVGGFVVAEVCHFIAMASLIGCETTSAKIVFVSIIAVVSILALGFGLRYVPSLNGTFVGLYAFHYAECLSFSLVLLLNPALMYLSDSFSATSVKPTLPEAKHTLLGSENRVPAHFREPSQDEKHENTIA